MATTSLEIRPRLAPNVQSLLAALRRRIRLYVWLEGLAAAAAWLGAAFWGSLLIDWFFEPAAEVRAAIVAVVGCVLLGIVVRKIGRRAFVRLTDENMAMLLERRYDALDDSLLTAVCLAGYPARPDQCNPQMLQHTCHHAARQAQQIGLSGVFNPAPLLQGLAAGGMLCASVVAFAVLLPDAFHTWSRRSLLLSSELWPRKTRLVVEGFENGVEKVARGADLQIVAKADTDWPLVPRTVQVRYRAEGGARGRATMNRLGIARRGKDPFQRYEHTFQGVLASIRFDLVGGDARVEDLRVEVVESPTIDQMWLRCQFPEYMGRTPRTLPHSGVAQVPQGTRLTIDAAANKSLRRVQIDMVVGEQSVPRELLQPGEPTDRWRNFQHTLASVEEDTTLLFTLTDTDGITSREPVRLTLVALPDEPPKLTARLDGIGPAITANARLPTTGSINDDYGIDRAWFEHAVDEQEPAVEAIAVPRRGTTELKLDAALEVADLKLTPGQKLQVCVKAADLYNLGEAPNVGSSDRWLLQIVTPEQLRTKLESRELILRQRLESIISEVTETRDLLLDIRFGQPPEGDKDDQSVDSSGDAPGGSADTLHDDLAAEPGDRPAENQDHPVEQRFGLRTLRIQQALQNSRKNAHETQGVADSVEDIRKQFINNRIDTQELNVRLKQQIADPLSRIAAEEFPKLEDLLRRLQDEVADDELGPRQRDAARQQADAILLQMQMVLDRMLELESFNEAVELLREIIAAQEKLGERTKQRQKQSIRQLLED